MRSESKNSKPTTMHARRQSPPDPLTPADAERVYLDQRRIFLAALAAHLDDAAVPSQLYDRSTGLAWREPDGRLNEVVVRTCESPSYHRGAPLVIRVFVGRTSWQIPREVYTALGITNRRLDGGGRDLELSVLPGELLDFAPWVAAWIIVSRSRHEGAVPVDVQEEMRQILDAPPFAFEGVLGDVVMSNSLWTTTAARMHDEWSARH